MNYHNITKDDMLNGDGLRVVLWVSGCNHHCKDCHNPVTWDVESGVPFDDKALDEIYAELSKGHVSGMTFSGGDPLHPANRECVLQIAKDIKHDFPNKTIWLYTGYSWEDVKDLEIVSYLDVLVDGEFKPDLADVNYNWAGSTNQRVIDVKKSIEEGWVILHASN
jgi:anaerobic ribonucleoside-triphosphate reductase activating protein